MPLTLAWIWIGSSSFEPNCIRKVCKTPWALLFKCDFEGYQRQTVSVHDWHISGFTFTFWKPRLQGVSHNCEKIQAEMLEPLLEKCVLIFSVVFQAYFNSINFNVHVKLWDPSYYKSGNNLRFVFWCFNEGDNLKWTSLRIQDPQAFTSHIHRSGKEQRRDNDVNAVNDCRAWRVWVSVVWRERKSLSVPGGRLGLFLFLLFSVPFSRGHSESSGPLELLNCRGSLFVAGSKGSGFRPIEGKNG